MNEIQITEQQILQRGLDKLIKEEEQLSERLRVLNFPDIVKRVESNFKNNYNGYTIVIENGDTFDIKIRNNTLRCEEVFVLPSEYCSKLIDILKLAVYNEISK